MYHTDDTIVAIATAPGGAARGIVRLSGAAVPSILERTFHSASETPLASIVAATVLTGTIGPVGQAGTMLAADVYLWPDRRSYTRQNVAEIHTLGSPPLLSALVTALCAAGARPAAPGEFTLRAFLAGRLDLTQAEAVLGVIDARGERDFQLAIEQLSGGLAQPLHELRSSLLDLLAQLEAGLDFVEEDIEFITSRQIESGLKEADSVIARLAAQLAERSHAAQPPRIALAGWPNVGKSSLFNALARGTALVCDAPGTTRDYLVASLDLGAMTCQLIDTAGAEPDQAVSDAVSAAAQRMTALASAGADLRLLCLDSTQEPNTWERRELAAGASEAQLVVLTKCDQPASFEFPAGALRTSATTGHGLPELREALGRVIMGQARHESAARLTAERCGDSLRAAGEAVTRAWDLNRTGGLDEFVAAEVRTALAELGKVVGAVYTDDILDRVFSRFCIGK